MGQAITLAVMKQLSPSPWLRRTIWVSVLILLAVIATAIDDDMPTDFICFWTAGDLLSQGQSPYDPALQKQVQHDLGWENVYVGEGVYEFMPYYYPPWFGLMVVPLLPLGYETAAVVWLFLGYAFLLLAGLLLRRIVPGLIGWLMVPATFYFFFSLHGVWLGQTAPLVLFLLAATWRLLDSQGGPGESATRTKDHAAGAVLALLTTKPQLTVVVIPALLIWAARQGRWRVVASFAGCFLLLCLVSTLILPDWPWLMVRAQRETLPPFVYVPGIGNTLLLVLEVAGLPTWARWLIWAAVVLPFLAVILHAAIRRRPVLDVLSLSILAAFYLAPYSQDYDLAVLVIPTFALCQRLPRTSSLLLLATVIGLPWLHLHWIEPRIKYTFFWVPLLLTLLWCVIAWKYPLSSRERLNTGAAA